ncbi:MAG: lytic transglycosylase domain-containing protein [Burkholderia sp.]
MIDLPVLVQECAMAVGPVTMQAIVRHESRGNPFAIGVNGGTVLKQQPKNYAEAVATAKALIQKGQNIDMGLGQINSSNLAPLKLTVEQVFEPCANLRAAETVLKWGYQQAVTKYGPDQRALLSALSAYNTGSLARGFQNGYVMKVVQASTVTETIQVPDIDPIEAKKAAASIVPATVVVPRTGNGQRRAANQRSQAIDPYHAPLDATGWDEPQPEKDGV